MNVSCPECRSVFRIDPAKVPAAGIRARCNVCGAVIPVEHPQRLVTADAVGTGAAAGSASDVFYAVEPSASMQTLFAPELESDSGTPEIPGDGAGAFEPEPPPTDGAPVPPSPSTTQPASVSPADAAAAAPPSAAPSGESATQAGARPVNPYLNNTPELRARRLARALVSDLVAYNPQKREQGLRDGTLRQLFRDEIRKSWDEYVEQVGASVAESTPHFQDALNDVLAGGRRVF